MHDLSKIWANVLKSLRGNNETLLHAVCSDVSVDFIDEYIFISTCNDGALKLLTKHLALLNKYAGGDYIKLVKPETHCPQNSTAEKLKKVFGDKLKIIS